MDGWCDQRFDGVREAFAENFASRGETGAAVCVSVEGRVVVDLAGGWADAEHTVAWQPDTLVNVYSVGKGLTSALAARLVGQGLLDVDKPVASYWPEFAQAGKEAVTVRQLLSHQAGLPAVRRPLADDAMLDWDLMTTTLAAETPWWEPGTGHGYHCNTFGYLVGEVIRRVTGRSPGTVLREDVAGPLGADVHLGLPATEHHRVAFFAGLDQPPPRRDDVELTDDQLMWVCAYFNPSGFSGYGFINTPAWREAEIPSTNTHASARGVARIYAALAAGGRFDGVDVVDPDALAAATTEQVYGDDLLLGRRNRFGLGFQLPQPERPLGPNPGAFGHFGAGGSLGFADPDVQVAFGYVHNQLGSSWQNPRNRALVDAVYACL